MNIIDENGKRLGILSRNEALRLAQSKNLDLLQVNPDSSKIITCKIVDYKKILKDQQLKNQNEENLIKGSKELTFGGKIAINDLMIKVEDPSPAT